MIVPKTRKRPVASLVVPFVLLCLTAALPISAAWAQQIDHLPADLAQQFAGLLLKAAADIEELPVPYQGDPAHAVGVVVDEKRGLILVPQKGIGKQAAPDMSVARGVPLALFFCSADLLPVIDGKLIDRAKLYHVTATGPAGGEHEANCMLLTVRKLSEDDYRLYGFGKADRPLIDVRFSAGKGPGAKPLAVEIKDIRGNTGAVVVTVFDKYQARFRGGVAE